jgi:predicted nucleic acid-binding protein
VVLDPSQVTAIERIQEHGNLIAHFGSRRINEVQRADKLLVTPGIEKARTPEDWRRAVDHFESKLKIWVTQDQALADLRDTSDILLTVFRHQKFMEGWK